MTVRVNPSPDANASAYRLATAIKYGGASDGWVTPATEESILAPLFPAVDESELNGFTISTSESSHTVTVNPGEGMIGGAAVSTDETATVSVNSEEQGQTIALAWNRQQRNDLIYDLEENLVNDNHYITIWEVDTDADGVIGTSDIRPLRPRIDRPNAVYDADLGGDGEVTNASNVTSSYKGNDIDSDGDGRVNEADYAEEAGSVVGLEGGEFVTVDGTQGFEDDTTAQTDRRYGRFNIGSGVLSPDTAPLSDYPLVFHHPNNETFNDSAGIAFHASENAESTHTPGASISYRRRDSWGVGDLRFWTKDEETEEGELVERFRIGNDGNVRLFNGVWIDDSDATFRYGSSDFDSLHFQQGSDSSSIPLALYNGNVGIQETNPSEMLDVGGYANFQEGFSVDGTDADDHFTTGGQNITVSRFEPSNPDEGDIWIDTS